MAPLLDAVGSTEALWLFLDERSLAVLSIACPFVGRMSACFRFVGEAPEARESNEAAASSIIIRGAFRKKEFWKNRFVCMHGARWKIGNETSSSAATPSDSEGSEFGDIFLYERTKKELHPFYWKSLCLEADCRTCDNCKSKMPPPRNADPRLVTSRRSFVTCAKLTQELACSSCGETSGKTNDMLRVMCGLRHDAKIIPYLSMLPRTFETLRAKLMFASYRDGCSAVNFKGCLEKCYSSLLVVTAVDATAREGVVCGIYLPLPWSSSKTEVLDDEPIILFSSASCHTFSNGASEDSQYFRVWRPGQLSMEERPGVGDWLHINDKRGISIGGGFGNSALTIDRDFARGTSWPTSEFGNLQSLCGSSSFKVSSVELFGVVNGGTPRHRKLIRTMSHHNTLLSVQSARMLFELHDVVRSSKYHQEY
eukprot:GHVU01095982.1.p1 GENE.GHVU01095982.1~~GHVU01095982.1.p1  ORF type:complete len:424 (+),score=42.27 GHVU01095982.1:342-1613(+)